MNHRESLIRALQEALEARPDARAAWLGGSDATGRTDEASDVDLVVLGEEGAADALLSAIEEAVVREVGPLDARHRMPPSPLDLEQLFLHVAGWGPEGLVDACVLSPGQEGPWLVRERHGEPLVLFDRGGTVRPGTLDRASHGRQVAARIARLRSGFPVFAPMALKEARRGRVLDAVGFWHGAVLRPLTDLLRCVHCPERFDFGLRYLDDDLPPAAAARLKALAFPTDVADIERLYPEAMTLYDEALARWDQQRPGES